MDVLSDLGTHQKIMEFNGFAMGGAQKDNESGMQHHCFFNDNTEIKIRSATVFCVRLVCFENLEKLLTWNRGLSITKMTHF